jgi:Flp pilus assembly protein TadG
MHGRLPHSSKSRAARRAGLRRFARDEEGAAYTLSFVMVMPIYALLMCLIIEASLMLTAKMGTIYAAFAAARSASAWSSHTTWEKAKKKADRAALKSMVPFASGTQPIEDNLPPLQGATDTLFDAGVYWAAYQRYAKDPVDDGYLAAKYAYALKHVTVSIDGPPKTWDADITAKVTYNFPFNVPGIGRILGKRGDDGNYYYSITSAATIPNEGPQDNRKTIGIGYGTLD